MNAPGLSWKQTSGDEYRYVAAEINRRIAARFPDDGDGTTTIP